MELASLSNRFSFFENFEEKEAEKAKNRPKRLSPTRELGAFGQEPEENGGGDRVSRQHLTERDIARRDCKAGNILKKFKEMEEKVKNGEDDGGDKRPLKRFTPPRKLGSDESDYSGSDYSDSDSYTDSYSDSSDYTDSESDSEDEGDETLRAIRATQRAKALRAKFEEWENTADAKEQERQIQLTDENGYSLDTASHLKKRFEALQIREQMEREAEATKEATGGGSGREVTKFKPKRFK